MKRILTIAGSDSGGGAGIQADLKAITLLGGYGMSVITALTAQNTVGVQAIHEVPARFVERQIDSVLSDIGADAIKTGMLANQEIVEVVAKKIRQYGVKKVVVDPVMVCQERSLPSSKRCPGGSHQKIDSSRDGGHAQSYGGICSHWV